MTAPITPPIRDANGLLPTIPYTYTTDGRINWRALVPPQYLYVSSEFEIEVKTTQNVNSKWDIDVTKVPDKQLVITLAGLKWLARVRGLKAVRASDLHVTDTEVTSVCTVEFIPNRDDPEGLTVGVQASASVYSVSGKFQLYLAALAQNRAYSRAVKDALGIEILGAEEVDFKASKAFEEQLKRGNNPLIRSAAQVTVDEPTKANNPTPVGFLEKLCGDNKITFEALKVRAVEIRAELGYVAAEARGDNPKPNFDPVNWTGFNEESIMANDALILMDKIRVAVDKKIKKKA